MAPRRLVDITGFLPDATYAMDGDGRVIREGPPTCAWRLPRRWISPRKKAIGSLT